MRRMLFVGVLAMVAIGALVVVASAQERVVVPGGAKVILAFDQPVDLRLVQTGDILALHVAQDVLSGEQVVVRRGTAVTGTITRVGAHPGVGKRGRLRLELSPVQTAFGPALALRPQGLMRRGTLRAGRPLRVRAGEQMLAVVPSETVVVAEGASGPPAEHG